MSKKSKKAEVTSFVDAVEDVATPAIEPVVVTIAEPQLDITEQRSACAALAPQVFDALDALKAKIAALSTENKGNALLRAAETSKTAEIAQETAFAAEVLLNVIGEAEKAVDAITDELSK